MADQFLKADADRTWLSTSRKANAVTFDTRVVVELVDVPEDLSGFETNFLVSIAAEPVKRPPVDDRPFVKEAIPYTYLLLDHRKAGTPVFVRCAGA